MKTITVGLLWRAVLALEDAHVPDAHNIADEIRSCLEPPPEPPPIEGQITVFEALADSSSSQPATLPGDA